MNHAITIGGLLSVLGLILGLIVTAWGALSVFAVGMATNPSQFAGDEKAGCITAIIGLLICGASLAGLLS